MQQIAFQGEPGAYGEQAAISLFGEQITPVPKRTFAEVIQAVSTGETEGGVLPVINSTAGPVVEAWDLLQQSAGLLITGEFALRIHHCLLCLPGQTLHDIKRIISHPQALAQCEKFLAPLRDRGVLIDAIYDTAGGAKLIREEHLPGVAAIASARAATIYNLIVLAQEIESLDDNTTQFVALQRSQAVSSVLSGTSVRETLARFSHPFVPGGRSSALPR
jgi:prephenate dehydratase